MVVLGVAEEYSDEVIPDGSYVPADVIGELPLDSEGVMPGAPDVVGELPLISEDVVSVAPGVVGDIPLGSDDMVPVAEADVPGS